MTLKNTLLISCDRCAAPARAKSATVLCPDCVRDESGERQELFDLMEDVLALLGEATPSTMRGRLCLERAKTMLRERGLRCPN